MFPQLFFDATYYIGHSQPATAEYFSDSWLSQPGWATAEAIIAELKIAFQQPLQATDTHRLVD